MSDFRSQLSSLQRAVPTRSVTVRTMGRSLAPSTLSRPAAAGRPGTRSPARAVPSPRGQNSYGGPPRGNRADGQRMQEASLRTRSHGARDASVPMRRPLTAAGNATSDVKRRRANVLFVLVLTTVCGGFLAATTDSKAMVYLFALGMIALGGYVYMLIALNQRENGAVGMSAGFVRSERAQRYTAAAPQRRVAAPRDPLVRDWRAADDYDDQDQYDERDYDEPRRAPTRRPAAQPSAGYRYRPASASLPDDDDGELPGSGRSGRISYGRGPAPRAAVTRDPYAMPTPRDPRDPFGREQPGREITRGTPVRNGRHATGQHPVQGRRSQPVRRGSYSQAG